MLQPTYIKQFYSLIAKPRLNRVPDHSGNVAVVKCVNRDNARGRRHVDLGQIFAADHIDADKYQPAFAQMRAKDGADFGFAGC